MNPVLRVALLALLAACRTEPGDGKTPSGDDPTTPEPSPTTPVPSTPDDTDTDSDTTFAVAATGPWVDDLVGVNGFIDDPLDRLAAFGIVREYHNWGWADANGASPPYPDNELTFDLWGGYWDWDAYYGALHAAGTTVFPALQGSIPSLGDALPPVPAGADPTDPASYVAHADLLFQFAARYGAVAVPDAELKLAADQVRVSGLGYLQYYEDGNELDATWVTPDGSNLVSPEEYAAMASADRDGDEGRLGPGLGVQAADPDGKLVMSGLAGTGPADWVTNVTTYLDGVLAWSDAHRSSFPVDAINVHLYCFGPDGFGVPNPRPGLAPEECGLRDQLAAIDAWRDAHVPDRELWLTEFGYDTDPASNLRAPATGSRSAQEVQAQWLVRSVLAIAESGFDRSMLFVSRDGCSAPDCPGHEVQFTTSGVLLEKGDFTPKTSFWFLASFRAALAGTRFLRVVQEGEVRVDAFQDPDGGGAYVLWLPSSTDASRPGTVLDVPGATTAELVRLVDGSATGEVSPLVIVDGQVTVDVDETPALVRVDQLL